ncbi:MAG: FapA family protein [Chloroflexi bacterium]|nr:FapA family protein [Chloroflexota bacterium]
MSNAERQVRVTARTLEDARRQAARLLRVPVAEVRVEVLAAKRSGLFGLGAPQLEVVGRTTAAPPEELRGTLTLPSPAAAGERATMASGWRVWCQEGACLVEVSSAATTLEDIEDHVRAWPLDEYDREAVRLALRVRDGRPVRFARISAAGEGPLGVRVTEDSAEAWLVPAQAVTASVAELRAALAEAGIVNGIDESMLAAAAGRELAEPLLLAHGSEGTPSRDAAVEYLFSDEDDGTSLAPLVREDGSVDYRELKPIATVNPGDVLGHYLPAVDGEPARDVFGKAIGQVAAGQQTRPAEFAGAGVSLAENGIDFVATRAGRPWRNGARIEVSAVYTVPGDVDFSSGNVDFAGDVFVAGDVKPGFTVKATGNVRIDGMVDAGFVECGRELLVRGGIHGHGESTIRCGGSMSGRFIEAASLTADSDVLVVSTIVRSTVTAGGQVTVLGRGSIVGGKVKAVGGISCTAAGSAAGVATSLELDWLGALKPGTDRGRELARLKQARVIVYGDVFPGVTVNINGAKFPVRDQIRGVQFQGTDRGIALIPTN